MNNKHLTPAKRCIENLDTDMGLTKTGMNPAEYEKYEAAQKAKIEQLHKLVDAMDNPPEPLTQGEIDLIIQNNLS